MPSAMHTFSASPEQGCPSLGRLLPTSGPPCGVSSPSISCQLSVVSESSMGHACGLPSPRIITVTVDHEYLGPRVYHLCSSSTTDEIKKLFYEETDLPVNHQNLFHHNKLVADCVELQSLISTAQRQIRFSLQMKGLRGGGKFGQSTPPLVDFLKDILRRYPEGGQILKELVQNAEDAGASDVKFLYDECSHGTDSLWCKELAKFQGPALYSYNNAVFMECDWKGIQETARSQKKDDPLKVGRFGLGFNSVYHVTDLPSILSGEQIGILDPHEAVFGARETGRSWHLLDDCEEIQKLHDQFSPYMGLFGNNETVLGSGHFPGTIFRFPLRKSPSQLSSNLYSKEEVMELFHSFIADADTVLLFLKNVKKVSLHIREQNGTETMLFSVSASVRDESENVETLEKAIRSYCERKENSTMQTITFAIDITIQKDLPQESLSTSQSWLVTNGIAGRGICREVDLLADELNFPPLVGVAVPLDIENQGDCEGTFRFSGRTFCLLPLPPTEDSKTGLPVHINGFFGLTDNRRGVRWLAKDQRKDQAALWNELLVGHVIPKAYAALICKFIKNILPECEESFTSAVYRLWPTVENVHASWKPLLQPLFEELFQQPIICSMTGGWMKIHEVIFHEDCLPSESAARVLEYLTRAGLNIATINSAVRNAIWTFYSRTSSLAIVTPALVRQTLRSSGVEPEDEECHMLLEYILTDCDYNDLHDLRLLPLQNGSFGSFYKTDVDKEPIYIPSKEHPRSIFFGMDAKFLSDDVSDAIKPVLSELAKNFTHDVMECRLVNMNTKHAVNVLKETMLSLFPGEDLMVVWTPGGENGRFPPRKWLQECWEYIYHNFAHDLTPLEDFPLIPRDVLLPESSEVTLLRLRKSSLLMLREDNGVSLPESVAEIISNLGGIVLEKLDSCVFHPLLKDYVKCPLAANVAQLFGLVGEKLVCEMIDTMPVSKKINLRGFLAGITNVKENEGILKALSIFKKLNLFAQEVEEFVTLENSRVLHHSAILPPNTKLSQSLIDCSDEATARLMTLLQVPQLKTMDCLTFMFEDIAAEFYSFSEVTDIMTWVLVNLPYLKSENLMILDKLRSFRFIPFPSGIVSLPSELFDPNNDNLKKLFAGAENLFPPPAFCSPDVLHALRQVGLKTEDDLCEKDFVFVAQQIEKIVASESVSDIVLQKAQTLMMELGRPGVCNIMTEQTKMELQRLKWVPAMSERPSDYPSTLTWKAEKESFCAPADMTDVSYAKIVGSSIAVVEVGSTEVGNMFGLYLEPPTKYILEHLEVVVNWQRNRENGENNEYLFHRLLFEVYEHMQKNLQKDGEQFLKLQFAWVWTGRCFSTPASMMLTAVEDLDLEPYLYLLPKSLSRFGKLFEYCGSLGEVTSSNVLEVLQQIKKNSDDEEMPTDPKAEVRTALNIMHWLHQNQVILHRDTPILIQTEEPRAIMKPIHACTYCDIKVDDLHDILEDAAEPIFLLHDDIPMKTAEWLNIPCLSTRLINPENLGFEQYGQHEPLAVRIRNILQEYPSVSDIFKELIQNADDAGASKCSFMVDLRTNSDMKDNLLDPGMAACHGPALWAYNDAVFTDSDFANITRLGHSFKKDQMDKVGKFGLGFNSVYHITDVPTFISRQFMIMFDPNICHLNKHIRDKSNPGIKLNWAAEHKRLQKFPNQFHPFMKVFGCDLPLTRSAPYEYPGTLFRLPFRTEQEAAESEISKTFYNIVDISSFIEQLKQSNYKLIIFTQNVEKMALKCMEQDITDPAMAKNLIMLSKTQCPSVVTSGPCNILTESARFIKELLATGVRHHREKAPMSSSVVTIDVEGIPGSDEEPLGETSAQNGTAAYFEIAEVGKESLHNAPSDIGVEQSYWLIHSCMVTEQALDFCLQEEGLKFGLIPCGGLAVPLQKVKEKWKVRDHWDKLGEIFCYLPLRIKTGLPVHINGCFAVSSNRKEIWKTDFKGKWNNLFMKDVICQVYINEICLLRDMALNGELVNYTYHDVWPNPNAVHNDFSAIWKAFYRRLCLGEDNRFEEVFSDGKKWVSIKDARFLDDKLFNHTDIGQAAFETFSTCLQRISSQTLCPVMLPTWVKRGFERAGCLEAIEAKTITEKRFFRDVFMPNIQDCDSKTRDLLLLYILDTHVVDFMAILWKTPCIPCSAEDKHLSCPSRLIHPSGKVSKLYDDEDGRFPDKSASEYLDPVRLVKLERLGMMKDCISWEDLIERVQSISALVESDKEKACSRTAVILQLINEKLCKGDRLTEETIRKLRSIPFLPQLQIPEGFPLKWKISNDSRCPLFSANELYTSEHQDLVCLLHSVLNENKPGGCGSLPIVVKELLGLLKKPSIQMVVDQLKEASLAEHFTSHVEDICYACYKYLNDSVMHYEHARAFIIEEMQKQQFILVENRFVSAQKVAFNLEFSAAPYLFQLPIKLRTDCRELFDKVGVKQQFLVSAFLSVLQDLKQTYGSKQLDNEDFQLCRRIITEGICNHIRDKDQHFCQAFVGQILLPDTNMTLHLAECLCYNDCPWITMKDSKVRYCHPEIPREIAVKLGVVPKRHKALEKYASNVDFSNLGTEFGQREKLTNRIRSILNAYPSENEMLKELLQNADDAEATEIHFIWDPREHPKERIFDEKWGALQGPALCVYNNQPFSVDDIRGIQHIGRGTKMINPNKTGQYGIGFNSVYHITDCPMLLSNNSTLCIFDPHSRFAPGASTISPGRMFTDIDEDFRLQFSDVLQPFLGNLLTLENSVMFRFPIRTHELAKKSEIVSIPMPDRMVNNLMDSLRSYGAELLLFLNHIEKVSISEMDHEGKMNVLYSVEIQMSENDRIIKKGFCSSIYSPSLQSYEPSRLGVQQVSYKLDMTDSDDNATSWLLCNRFGFSDAEDITPSLLAAFKNNDIALLPRGGVAACISPKVKNPSRAFCFLPLSMETGLPVHINGHFALDASRRSLWREDGISIRGIWNTELLTKIIAPAYTELLFQLQKHCFEMMGPHSATEKNISLLKLQQMIKRYFNFFPLRKMDIYLEWQCIVSAVYRWSHALGTCLIPVVREVAQDRKTQSDDGTSYNISWHSSSSPMNLKPYFDNLLQAELQAGKNTNLNLPARKAIAENVFKLKHILMDIGFKLVHSSEETNSLHDCFLEAGVPVDQVTPQDICTFLRTFQSGDSICQLGALPCPLKNSKFKLFQNIKILVDYCLKNAEERKLTIDGLPLLVTMDGVLQVFDGKKPKFLATHSDLFSSRGNLFMESIYTSYQETLHKCGVAKPFTVQSFSELLPISLPKEYNSKTVVPWSHDNVGETWLKRCWQFLLSASKDSESSKFVPFEGIVNLLKEWALLPAVTFTESKSGLLVPKKEFLAPLGLMKFVIFPQMHNDPLVSVLMKAGCLHLMLPKISSCETQLSALRSRRTATIEDCVSILHMLEYMIKSNTFNPEKLNEKDNNTILGYFAVHLGDLGHENIQATLKMIPCYKTIGGNFVSLHKFRTCHVLTKSVPAAEMESWTKFASAAFLVDNMQFRELYVYLGCIPIGDLEVYLKYILPKFDTLSNEAKLHHVIHLQKHIVESEQMGDWQQKLIARLESLLFILDVDGRLKSPKSFYDKTIKLYNVMLPEKSFIPDSFFESMMKIIKPSDPLQCQHSWVKFLRTIGLKHDIPHQQLLFFARDIANKSQTERWTFETLKRTVDIFLDHLFQERDDLFTVSLLRDLSSIAFIYPKPASRNLVHLHPQFQESKGTLPLIRFSGSQVSPSYANADSMLLLWTSCLILPETACPKSIREQRKPGTAAERQMDNLLVMLNTSIEPPIEKVIAHCKTICSVLPTDEEAVLTRTSSLMSIYTYLNAQQIDFRYKLRGVPIVAVEEGRKLVKAEEVIITMENEVDLRPYLYKLPIELSLYHRLFKLLGMEDMPTVKQYVDLLSRISKEAEDKRLEAAAMRTVKQAVAGLFKKLQADPGFVRTELENIRDTILYLPSHNGKLVRSNRLMFDDSPHFRSRIQNNNMSVELLMDFSQCFLGNDHVLHAKLVSMLPSRMRPKSLSSTIEEHLDDADPKPCQYGRLCSLQGRLQLLLSSEQFTSGLLQIVKHENESAFLANEDRCTLLCKAFRELLKVTCYQKLQTTIYLKDSDPVSKTRCDTLAFLQKTNNDSVHLYVQHSDLKDINFLLSLAIAIKSGMDNLISDASYLIAMLGCSDMYRISNALDNLGIKSGGGTGTSKVEMPNPGTLIPPAIHHLLVMDPTNVFDSGEYVGYLVDAEGKDNTTAYQPVYTYSVVVQEVDKNNEEDSVLEKFYLIDVGYNEYKVVSSLDLYKLLLPEDSFMPDHEDKFEESNQQNAKDEFPTESPKGSPYKMQTENVEKTFVLKDILNGISTVLERAWKGPEGERKKIIRRLYLKWHPDKNVERYDIATEVFKHLQNEIKRLASVGRNVRAEMRRHSYPFHTDAFSFERFFKSWNQEATSHRKEEKTFHSKCSTGGGTKNQSDRSSPHTSFNIGGNPLEARRWIRQARVNLSAARNDLHRNANEWVCLKCYQAVKFGLIAVEYSVWGQADKDTKIQCLAERVESLNPVFLGLTNDVLTLEVLGIDALKTQYPDVLPFPQIPNDRFSTDIVLKVLEFTGRILIRLENFLRQQL
uniref:sacsin n=1 Tax=Myxine glutinosa TaxID=7769 RepID=UPI00358E8447